MPSIKIIILHENLYAVSVLGRRALENETKSPRFFVWDIILPAGPKFPIPTVQPHGRAKLVGMAATRFHDTIPKWNGVRAYGDNIQSPTGYIGLSNRPV